MHARTSRNPWSLVERLQHARLLADPAERTESRALGGVTRLRLEPYVHGLNRAPHLVLRVHGAYRAQELVENALGELVAAEPIA